MLSSVLQFHISAKLGVSAQYRLMHSDAVIATDRRHPGGWYVLHVGDADALVRP